MNKALLIAAICFTSPAFAADEDPANSSAYACAKSVQTKTGADAFEVVRMTQRGGSGNYRIWLNDHDEQLGGYCETFHKEVMRVYTKASPWQKTNMYKPSREDLAAR